MTDDDRDWPVYRLDWLPTYREILNGKNRSKRMPPVDTTDANKFDDGEHGKFCVMGAETRRTFCKTEQAAVTHAENLLESKGQDSEQEFLIVKVVGRVRYKTRPKEYIKVK